MYKFPEKLKELRQELKLTQREFGERLNISVPVISTYERGDKTPSFETVYKIAREFNVSLDWLCGLPGRMLLANEPRTNFDMLMDIVQVLTYNNSEVKFEGNTVSIVFSDKTLIFSLHQIVKLFDLKNSGQIGNDVIEAWIEKVQRDGRYSQQIDKSIPEDSNNAKT